MEYYNISDKQNTKVESQFVTIENLKEFIHTKAKDIFDGYAVCWLHHKVMVGQIDQGNIHYENDFVPDYGNDLLRIRLFNEEKEWHIWCTRKGFRARIREDNKTESASDDPSLYIDSELILWGTQTKNLENGFLKSFEERGTALVLPQSLGTIDEHETRKRFVLQTRNYIDFNEIGQAGYVDSRFVSLRLKEF